MNSKFSKSYCRAVSAFAEAVGINNEGWIGCAWHELVPDCRRRGGLFTNEVLVDADAARERMRWRQGRVDAKALCGLIEMAGTTTENLATNDAHPGKEPGGRGLFRI